MRKIYLMAASLMISSLMMAQDFSNALQYMDYIGKQQENITTRFLSYTSASAHGKREKKVEALRMKLMDEIQNSRMNVSSMPPFNKDKSFRDTAVNFMKFYFNVMNDDYAKIINMEEIAEQSYDEMEAYLLLQEKVDQKLAEANARMKKAQYDFGAANNIKITESTDEKNNMMKVIGAVNKHYHEVYLLFFKPFVQEKNMMAALDKGNLTAVEQSRGSMLKFAQEGLAQLKNVKAYNGDGTLIDACRQSLTFYEREAKSMAPIMDYYMAKERFEAQKKEFDKNGGSRSKEAVDAYNKAVKEMNAASQNSNNANKDLNKSRSETLDNWNKSVRVYFDTNTPRFRK